jgi:hypothetical protein
MISRAVRVVMFIAFLLSPVGALAQGANPPPDNSASNSPLLKPEELDALLAPIALYPDNLLSQVLMASTFPLEVVQAARWLEANKKLSGDQLEAAVAKQDWEDSIKSLVATPSVLTMMNDKLDWTQKLGNAVVGQQPEVMDAIQRLRAKAQANNKLQSTKEQTVTVTQSQGKQVIAIAPTDPNTVYVPYYDPGVVYGSWPYPAYPPYYWPAPGYIAGGLIATGLAFGAGYALGRWASGGYWGGNVNWNNNNITINRPGGGAGNWDRGAHVEHRSGNRGNRQLDFRGSGGQQVLRPGGERGNLGSGGERGNLGNRNHAATRPSGGNRPQAGTRPAGGNRPQAGNRPSGGIGEGRANAGNRVQHRAGGGGGARVQHRAGGGAPRAANLGGRGGGVRAGGGGGHRAAGGGGFRGGGGGGARAGGGGGHRGGGGGGGGGRGGGRRSDIRLKHDIVLIGHLANGLGVYRFVYNGETTPYVGVMAQEVQQVVPQAVERGPDGYLRVHYEKLGLKFESYRHWLESGARLPAVAGDRP